MLDYLRVLLTGPVIGGGIALTFMLLFRVEIKGLISRVASLRFPGGELSAPQPASTTPSPATLPEVPAADLPKLPASVAPDQQLQAQLNAERARSYLWEYRYLNSFLVPATQKVLEWFAAVTSSTTYAMYDTYWTTAIPDPNQRNTILAVLQTHHLVQHDGELFQITPKGREYLEWRTKV